MECVLICRTTSTVTEKNSTSCSRSVCVCVSLLPTDRGWCCHGSVETPHHPEGVGRSVSRGHHSALPVHSDPLHCAVGAR